MMQRRYFSFVRWVCFQFCLLTLLPAWVEAQSRKIKDFPVRDVVNVSIDRLGDFYLVLQGGIIQKYDTNGNYTSQYRHPDSLSITLLEPWNPLRVFVYSRDYQVVTLLDRFLVPQERILLDPSLAVEPSLASPILNSSFWLLDQADNSLKKIDQPAGKTAGMGPHVIQEVNLKLSANNRPEFTFLREYQNQLFLTDRNSGVYRFSILGKQMRLFPVRNLNFLGFLGEEIYFLENGKIRLFDLYSEDQRELSVDPDARWVLLTDERMVIVKKSSVEVWEFKP